MNKQSAGSHGEQQMSTECAVMVFSIVENPLSRIEIYLTLSPSSSSRETPFEELIKPLVWCPCVEMICWSFLNRPAVTALSRLPKALEKTLKAYAPLTGAVKIPVSDSG